MLIVLLLVFNLGVNNVYAQELSPIKILINGEELKTDVGVEVVNERTMLPLRAVFEKMGCKVDWNNDTKQITASNDKYEMKMTISSTSIERKNLSTNETNTIVIDQAPLIKESRTLVPVRFVAESLDKVVYWDNNARCVIIHDRDMYEKSFKDLNNLVKLLNASKDLSSKGNEDIKMNFDMQLEGLKLNIDGDFNIKTLAKENSSYDCLMKMKVNATATKTSDAVSSEAIANINKLKNAEMTLYIEDMNKICIKTNILNKLGLQDILSGDMECDLEKDGIIITIPSSDASVKQTRDMLVAMQKIVSMNKSEMIDYIIENVKTQEVATYVDSLLKMYNSYLTDDKFTLSGNTFTFNYGIKDLQKTLEVMFNNGNSSALMPVGAVDQTVLDEVMKMIKVFDLKCVYNTENNQIKSANMALNFNANSDKQSIKLTLKGNSNILTKMDVVDFSKAKESTYQAILKLDLKEANYFLEEYIPAYSLTLDESKNEEEDNNN